MKKRIFFICGARPNFMKIAPILAQIRKTKNFDSYLIHTGQHYDKEMSSIFFKDLSLPKPDFELNVGSNTHAVQTAKIMMGLEKIFLKSKPSLVVVVGDVNSTLAAALVCSKLNIKLAHIEAGLRSFDRTMPEEINRILTDRVSDYLFTTSKDANLNLENEGINRKKIFFVGNVMIDTLLKLKNKAKKRTQLLKKLKLKNKSYALLTLHRPSNVDQKDNLRQLFKAFKFISQRLPIVFPVHPRTESSLKRNFPKSFFLDSNIIFIKPQGYSDFLKLMLEAKLVLTDSGGIQEETTVLDIPCLTLRNNTERPITIQEGTNILVGVKPQKIINETLKIINGSSLPKKIPKFWDGEAAKRIAKILLKCQKH